MNVEFLVICYFVGMFVDWVFQTDWQATNKSNWSKGNRGNAFEAVYLHSMVYTLLTLIITTVLLGVCGQHPEPRFVWLVGPTLFISHFIIDTRILVKLIMRAKGMTKEQVADVHTYGFMHIGIDHRLHEVVILVLSFLVGKV